MSDLVLKIGYDNEKHGYTTVKSRSLSLKVASEIRQRVLPDTTKTNWSNFKGACLLRGFTFKNQYIIASGKAEQSREPRVGIIFGFEVNSFSLLSYRAELAKIYFQYIKSLGISEYALENYIESLGYGFSGNYRHLFTYNFSDDIVKDTVYTSAFVVRYVIRDSLVKKKLSFSAFSLTLEDFNVQVLPSSFAKKFAKKHIEIPHISEFS